MYALKLDKLLENTKDTEMADILASLVSRWEMDPSSHSDTSITVTGLFFPVYPREEAANGLSVSYTDASLRNFVAQSIL